ncbi:MAG: hypothetical protein ACKVT0_02580 [Planctomycetaceae bacterium]
MIRFLLVSALAVMFSWNAAWADEFSTPLLGPGPSQQFEPNDLEGKPAFPAIRPQQKKIVQPGKPIHIAIIGAISRPGVYRFDNGNPQVNDLVQVSGPFTTNHSGVIRIIRDARPGLQTYHSPKNRISLLDGDVVLIEERAESSHTTSADHMPGTRAKSNSSTSATPNPYIQSPQPNAVPDARTAVATKNMYVACVNLIDRPVVINLNKKFANVPALMHQLGQSQELISSVRLIHAQRRSEPDRVEQPAANTGHAIPSLDPTQTDRELSLTGGTVLVFDRSQVDASRVPRLPSVISAAQANIANSAPDARAANRSRRTETQYVNPHEPAPFPDEPAAPVPSLPYVESNADDSADAGLRVEKTPAPPSLTGPNFGSSQHEAGLTEQDVNSGRNPTAAQSRISGAPDLANPVLPDVPMRTALKPTTPRSENRRLKQEFGNDLPVPAPDTPYHPAVTHQGTNTGESLATDDADAAALQSTSTRSPLQQGPTRQLDRARNNLLMFLTGATIALLCIGSILFNKYRAASKLRNAAMTQTAARAATHAVQETPADVVASAARRSASASILPAILDPRYPVVNESFPISGKLELSGSVDTDRMLRVDQVHPLRAPITQSEGFSAGLNTDASTARHSANGMPSDQIAAQKNAALRIDSVAESPSNAQNSREVIDSRLARFTNHEKRRSYARPATRMRRTDLGHVTADAALNETDAIGSRRAAATNRPRTELRAEKAQTAGEVDHRVGLLDRALALLQRERTS